MEFYFLLGKTGSGKSTVYNNIKEHFNLPILVTTRKKRNKDDNDYEFVGEEWFFDNLSMFDMIKSFYIAGEGNVYYGVFKKSYGDRNLIITDYKSFNYFVDKHKHIYKIKAVYIDMEIEQKTRLLLNRGDNIKEIQRRSEQDNIDFSGIEKDDRVSYIYNNGTPEELIRKVLKRWGMKY